MNESNWLAGEFEDHRAHLRGVAYRMLGSLNEADDAVQEAWLRLSRSDVNSIENLGGWLTTVVSRVCLDMLRSRKSRREEPLDVRAPEPILNAEDSTNPEHEALLAESVGHALLVVLETLAPAERVAFVLHDIFAVPFDEIAPIVSRSPVAARQLASRARRRVQGASSVPDTDLNRQREVVDAFLAASRNGDLDALLAVLDPDVMLRADQVAVSAAAGSQAYGAPPLSSEIRGASDVADTFSGRAHGAQLALVDGAVGATWAPGGRPRAVFSFMIVDGQIIEIEVLADPDNIRQLDVTLFDG